MQGGKLNTRLPINLTAVVGSVQFLLELGNSRGCSLLKEVFYTSTYSSTWQSPIDFGCFFIGSLIHHKAL